MRLAERERGLPPRPGGSIGVREPVQARPESHLISMAFCLNS